MKKVLIMHELSDTVKHTSHSEKHTIKTVKHTNDSE